jgi:hypothetical protein
MNRAPVPVSIQRAIRPDGARTDRGASDGRDPQPASARPRLTSLFFLALGAAGVTGCLPEGPAISTGALDGDETQVDASTPVTVADAAPDARPGTPDAHPVPDAPPGAPDAAPIPDAAPDARPAIPEVLDVAFDTTSNGGQYSPKNIVAVWIERADGTFVKTIGRWAGTRRSHLIGWVQKSGSDADAVSGATRSNHNARLTVHWDFKDRSGALVPDGAYNIRMELADKNSVATSQNREGTFPLQKSGTASSQTTSGSGFENVAIDYSGR